MGLKLSRAAPVEERWLRPTGLYPDADVDLKKLRRLILDRKLAPCYEGLDEEPSSLEVLYEDCPICFLHYPSVNRSRCCKKGICTECFLQVKAPAGALTAPCPYCKTEAYAVEYHGPRSAEDHAAEKAEEQRVIELKIRSRQQDEAGSSPVARNMQSASREAAESEREHAAVASRREAASEQPRTARKPKPPVAMPCARRPYSGRGARAPPADMLAEQEAALNRELDRLSAANMAMRSAAQPARRPADTIIDELLGAMGLRGEPLAAASQEGAKGKWGGGGGGNAVAIDDILCDMFEGAAALEGHQERAPTDSEMTALAEYLLSSGPPMLAQPQETVVGMVLVQYESAPTPLAAAVIAQPDGSSGLAQPVGAPSQAAAGDAALHEADIDLLGVGGGESVDDAREHSASGGGGDERIERAASAGDALMVAGLDAADARLAAAVSMSDQVASWSDMGARSTEARLMAAIHEVDDALTLTVSQDDSAISRAVLQAEQLAAWSANPAATGSGPAAAPDASEAMRAHDSAVLSRVAADDEAVRQAAAFVPNAAVAPVADESPGSSHRRQVLLDADAAFREKMRQQDEALRRLYSSGGSGY
mmetsp:Transcript_42686/g.110672  ORF Transcript_42686/g.110672 Transcript_42686/m.110672 type:complete len:595 (+) Transcript_42686:312-2096(+)